MSKQNICAVFGSPLGKTNEWIFGEPGNMTGTKPEPSSDKVDLPATWKEVGLKNKT